MVKEKLVNITYLGGSHGAFLKYFIDKFSKFTPTIVGSPFENNGTSHNDDVIYSGKVERDCFEDADGNPTNNYQLQDTINPNIVITVDHDSLMNFTRMFFTRKSDIELESTYVHVGDKSATFDHSFSKKYSDSFKQMYGIDINEYKKVPVSVMRDFIKITFLDYKNNQTLASMNRIKANLSQDVETISLSEIWNTDRFIKRMQQISDTLNLGLVLDADAVSLHSEFLSRRVNNETWNRVYNIIEALKKEENMDCSKLDIVEQGYLSSWIEQNYNFVQTPLTRSYFDDTNEILEYVKYYPNHYKAMNPNLPKFNNIDNPFYLWAKNKKHDSQID